MEMTITIISLVVTAMGMYASPLFSRPGIFFGASVDPEFRLSRQARSIVARYRLSVGAATGLALAALSLAAPHLIDETSVASSSDVPWFTELRAQMGLDLLRSDNRRASGDPDVLVSMNC